MLSIRAPGRICLFGEHQDYLGFPTISAAIDRYIFITGSPSVSISDSISFHISQPDIGQLEPLILDIPPEDQLLKYETNRDYFRSGINVARSNGVEWHDSWTVTIEGNIPINAGASSSSALIIAWLTFLFHAGNQEISPEMRANLGYQAEVLEFKEAGGQMDHFTSSLGGFLYNETSPFFVSTAIEQKIDGLILADSGIKKNTVKNLKMIKSLSLSSFKHISELKPDFNQFFTTIEEVKPYLESLSQDEQRILIGQLENRNITKKAMHLLNRPDLDSQALGDLLLEHHEILSKKIGVSVPKIDEMVNLAIQKGALGAKINGSGFGGTMFVYAPNNREEIVQAFLDEGYDCYAVEISKGAEIVSRS